ncbi:MAG: hypothetical protein ACHQ9S_22770 [Candidatus Binatia bacterium]
MPPQTKGIKDIFYETRVLMGREYTTRRFAEEVLSGTVEPVTLTAIEKGTRFPSEALVRRLAVVRKQDPEELLAILCRDRIVYAFGRELRRAMEGPRGVGGIEDADVAVLISRAIATLPEGDDWVRLNVWRQKYRALPRRPGQVPNVSDDLMRQVEKLLAERQLIEVRSGKVRRRGYHFVAKSRQEQQALALEFCALFSKGVLDKLLLAERKTGTYLRNHYFFVEPGRLPEFQQRLDKAVERLADEFKAKALPENRFLNVLITSTPL